MVFKLFLLFAVMPMIEIMILLQVAENIGGWFTFSLVLITAFIGAQLVRQQGISTMLTARTKMASGTVPGQELVEGVLLLIAGVLLVTPGFVTDGIGFLFVLPMTRPAIARFLMSQFTVKAMHGGFQGDNPFGGNSQAKPQEKNRTDGDIIEGEYHDASNDKNRLS